MALFSRHPANENLFVDQEKKKAHALQQACDDGIAVASRKVRGSYEYSDTEHETATKTSRTAGVVEAKAQVPPEGAGTHVGRRPSPELRSR